jgi:basic membrane lipoprotein Med (substrate-binding protein (PBP1-ABC) superfamily)
MTNPLRISIAQVVAIGLAFTAGSAVAAGLANNPQTHQPRTALVVAGNAANDKTTLAHAREADADLRVVHRNAEELGVTHMLAAQGYDTVVTLGVDERTAVKPVQAKYPDTHFVAVTSVQDALRELRG